MTSRMAAGQTRPAEPVVTPVFLQSPEPPELGASDASLVIWQRASDADLSAWLATLAVQQWPHARLTLSAEDVQAQLSALWNVQTGPCSAARNALLADVQQLLAWFSRLAGVPTVNLRLEAVTNNACRRWHQDSVPLRLITTYCGPGTEWVAPEYSQSTLSNADEDSPFAVQLQPFDVALFRGRGFPGQLQEGGIVHRSPRIDGLGLRRLVLVLDVPKACSIVSPLTTRPAPAAIDRSAGAL
jgi:hypothetical protein